MDEINIISDTSQKRPRNGKDRRYYLRHRDNIKARNLAYQASHREQRLARRNQHRLEILELARQRDRQYYATHRNIKIALEKQRDNQIKSLPSLLTLEQWKLIKDAFKNRCAYCGKKTKLLTQDHVIPVAKNGGYTANNIVPACMKCNSSKGVKLKTVQLALA